VLVIAGLAANSLATVVRVPRQNLAFEAQVFAERGHPDPCVRKSSFDERAVTDVRDYYREPGGISVAGC